MKMCPSCRNLLNWFNYEFPQEKFWQSIEDPEFLVKGKLKFCKSNFLDVDEKVKTCIQFYAEKLNQYINDAAKCKRKDFNHIERHIS